MTLVSTNKVRKQELVSTKLHPASDKSTENNMTCELVKTNAALLDKGTTRSEDEDTANFKHEAIGYTTKTATTMVVPTMNPFSRKKKTVLNPGSCSSAINLLNAMSLSSNVTIGGSSIFDDNKSSSSMVSYYYHQVHKSRRTKKVLNPGSCASALNFMLDMDFDDSQQRGGSMSDINFWFGGGGGNNHALSSSLPRRSSSLTTTTSGGLPRRRRSRSSITSLTRFNDNGKRNAEWGEFK